MASDRELRKRQEAGALTSATDSGSGPSDARGEIKNIHTRARNRAISSSENAATNIAESPLFTYFVNSKVREIAITVNANVANDTTDYDVITFRVRDANGANGQTVGSWNTHTSAQGALTRLIPAYVTVRTNADAEVDDGEQLTFDVIKVGAGKVINPGWTIDVWAEER